MKPSPSTILNIGSVACFVAFAFLYLGLRNDSTPALVIGVALMVVAMATPYVPHALKKISKK